MADAMMHADRITFRQVKENPKVIAMIEGANNLLKSMGYTEHGLRHVGIVSTITRYLMEGRGLPARECELGQITGFLHDVGNCINRVDHPISGAGLAYHLLTEMGMPIEEIMPILGAIGNHEELVGTPISPMSAALIIADKSDVHYSRVQNPIIETYDIHDRVNAAVQKSRIDLDQANHTITLTLEIDSSVATVMEYFEIFLSRMVMCRKSAQVLGCAFKLRANGVNLE